MTDTAKTIEVLKNIASAISDQAAYLTELDAAIGDNDHGINLNRGFEKVVEKLPSLSEKDIGTIFRQVGMTLVSTVGGSSGPLYGQAFINAGKAMAGKTTLSLEDSVVILQEAIAGVQLRGKAVEKEKTMLDAMFPALRAMKEEFERGSDTKAVLSAGAAAAKEGVEFTKTIIATKGRASYLGERSLGHADPGAASFTVLLDAVARSYE